LELGIFIDAIIPWTEVIALSVARPYGLTLTFIALIWFKADTGVLRIGIAISIAMPVVANAGPEVRDILEQSEVPIVLLVIKELIIGAIIGWLVSIPLVIASGAGAIIDTYRGASSGSTDPSGGQVTAIADLFMVTSLGLFAAVGGFWIVTDIIYQSYATWPIYSPMPDIKAGLGVFFSMISSLIKAAFILAAPIVTVMFLSDMTFLIAAKLGKKINVTFLAFSTKAIIAVAMLPFFSLVFLTVQKENFLQYSMINDFLKALLQ